VLQSERDREGMIYGESKGIGYVKRLITPILTILGIVCFSASVLHQIRNGWAGRHSFDLYTQYLPALTFAKQSVLTGTFPVWTPYQAVGQPFLGQMGWGLLYPMTWIILLLDVPDAIVVIQFLNIVIGTIGTLLYLRYLKLDWPAAILSALLFGYMLLPESVELTQISTFCWTPFIMLLTHRVFDRPTFRRGVVLSLCLAVSLLGGFSQHMYYTCVIVSIYLLFLICFSWSEYNAKAILLRLGLVGLAFLSMAGLSAAQLLPTLELSLHSVRSVTGVVSSEVEPFYVKLGVLGLDLFRRVTKTKFASFYFGSTLFLIPFAVLSKRHRAVMVAWFAILCYTIVFVLAEQTPALAVFGKIPLADLYRIHVRMLSFTRLAAAILAGIGLSSMWEKSALNLRNPETRKPEWFWILFIAYTLGILYFAFRQSDEFSLRSLRHVAIVLPCILLVLLLYASKLPFRVKRAAMWLVTLLVAVDFAAYNYFPELGSSIGIETNDAFVRRHIRWIEENAGYDRVLLNPPKPGPNIGNMYQMYNINSYDPFTLARWNNYVRFMIGPRQFDQIVSNTSLKAFYGILDYFSELLPHREQMLGLASVRYIVFGDNVYENQLALPRAYLVNSYTITKTESESLEAIRETFSRLSSSVILENGSPSFSSSASPSNPGEVHIRKYGSNEIDLSVETHESALVVLTDSMYPGWHAFVDGVEKPVWRANSLFRAVEVSPGRHTVLFTYQPASFRWGIAVSLLTFFLILVGLFIERHYSRISARH